MSEDQAPNYELVAARIIQAAFRLDDNTLRDVAALLDGLDEPDRVIVTAELGLLAVRLARMMASTTRAAGSTSITADLIIENLVELAVRKPKPNQW